MRKAIFAMAAGLGLCVAAGLAAEIASIDEIMTKAHKNKSGLRDLIAAELKKDSPDWADVQKKSKEFVTLATALPKFDPPKGDKSGWKKLCDSYLGDVKDLDAAAGKKDKSGAVAANEKLKKGCTPCHDAHRE